MNEIGKKQIANLAFSLKEMDIGKIYSSPLSRALDTAKAIAAYHKLPVEIESDLRELEVGDLEGITVAELGTEFSHHLLAWTEHEGYRRLPGGESLTDLKQRVWPAINSIIDNNTHETILIVSHYFAILTIICAALGLPLHTVRRMRIQPGSVSVINFDGIPCLTALSDICHLEGDFNQSWNRKL